MDVKVIMANLEAKHPGESEYLQAVQEVLESIEEVYNQHPEFEKAKIVEWVAGVRRCSLLPLAYTNNGKLV